MICRCSCREWPLMIPRVNSSKVTRCTRARSRPAGRGPRTAVQRNAPGRSRLPSRARCRANPGCSRPRPRLPRRSHRRCGSVGSDGGLSLGAIRCIVFVARTKNCASAALCAAPARRGTPLPGPPLAADETFDDVEIHAVEEQVRGAVAASVRPSRGTCPVAGSLPTNASTVPSAPRRVGGSECRRDGDLGRTRSIRQRARQLRVARTPSPGGCIRYLCLHSIRTVAFPGCFGFHR
jgi:hypothetical protein